MYDHMRVFSCAHNVPTPQLAETNTFYMQHILGVLIIIEEKLQL